MMEKVRELLVEQRLSRIVFENSFEGIIVTDANGRIQLTNPAFTDTTGYSAEEVIGRTPALLKSGRQDAVFYQAFWKALISGLAPPILVAQTVLRSGPGIFSRAPQSALTRSEAGHAGYDGQTRITRPLFHRRACPLGR